MPLKHVLNHKMLIICLRLYMYPLSPREQVRLTKLSTKDSRKKITS